MTNKIQRFFITKYGLLIIPIIALGIGMLLGYRFSIIHIKKLQIEASQKQNVIFDLERDCHGYNNH